ncbi:hypothetical protein LEP1GSC016_2489 [Leptospira borgpetersenii serovar Hardjo-bovis str. Sponselee]|uniref:Uncharacterized protein n=1 Tax=Leptospira borgpetersenii serovar Hardjo-bovis str. Sponselee TaxID=1303729 RepID=M6BF58_LEPBO|nr:hypothetical protein LEP1GSC016_2489 [Leptospira borgpetersenii serovar Hardjo-bovis str. Sponselee]
MESFWKNKKPFGKTEFLHYPKCNFRGTVVWMFEFLMRGLF